MPGIIEDWRELGQPQNKAQTYRDGKDSSFVPRPSPYSRPIQEGEDVLFNSPTPGAVVRHEKTWHRRAQELRMQGYSGSDIGEMLGKSQEQVRKVLRQPWAIERMNNRMKEDASAQIKEFLEEECLPSLLVLKEIRDNPNCRAADRKACADSLADRFLGRAAQPIYDVSKDKPVDQLTNDELSAQVNRLVEGMAATPNDPNKP